MYEILPLLLGALRPNPKTMDFWEGYTKWDALTIQKKKEKIFNRKQKGLSKVPKYTSTELVYLIKVCGDWWRVSPEQCFSEPDEVQHWLEILNKGIASITVERLEKIFDGYVSPQRWNTRKYPREEDPIYAREYERSRLIQHMQDLDKKNLRITDPWEEGHIIVEEQVGKIGVQGIASSIIISEEGVIYTLIKMGAEEHCLTLYLVIDEGIDFYLDKGMGAAQAKALIKWVLLQESYNSELWNLILMWVLLELKEEEDIIFPYVPELSDTQKREIAYQGIAREFEEPSSKGWEGEEEEEGIYSLIYKIKKLVKITHL